MNPIIAFAQQQNLYRILCVTYRTLPFVLIDFIDLRQEPIPDQQCKPRS